MYEPAEIEAKWQKVWEDEQTFHTPDPGPGEEPPNHWYQLEMLPYPSGTLHMGHVLNYSMGDVLTHFHRRHGLSVLRPMGWDSFDQTVVANEYVIDGHCERCGTLVELRNLEQWFFKITAYADELLRFDLPEGGSWPERTITIQRNWIGRSEGAEILFRVEELDTDIPVFTTRPDTLYGATFFVLAPEHPLVERIANDEVDAYVKKTAQKKTEERAAEAAKTGVFTGYYATNPVNGARIPIWVADYVLMDYGTGAIMAVPAHDERDREFAEAFDLPTKVVIDEDGTLVNSDRFDGLPAAEGARAIVEALEAEGRGKASVNYRL